MVAILTSLTTLATASKGGNEDARTAIAVFIHRIAKYIGAYAAVMNGVDAIVFTAGLGENSAPCRSNVCSYLGYLGMKVDAEKNKQRGCEFIFTTDDSKVVGLTIPTNEELVIARDTLALFS